MSVYSNEKSPVSKLLEPTASAITGGEKETLYAINPTARLWATLTKLSR
jgi:hypothetical protein